MSTRDILMLIFGLILVGLTIFFLYRGCSCLRSKPEGFENADDDVKLTKKELELFEDLQADKYSAKEIDKMVATGVIDQALVEKFLNKMDTFEAIEAEPEEEAEKPVAAKKPAAAAAAKRR